MSRTDASIAPAELADRLDEHVVIDVRTPGEFESVHIPHARNVPLDQLDRQLDEIRDAAGQGRPVLVCRSGARAEQARERLEAQGLGPAPVLDGGLVAWEQTGGDVVQGVIRWDLERQVRLVAGSIVLLSILLSIAFPPARYVAGAVGAGLVFAAVTNTCGMALALSRLPYNRPHTADAGDSEPAGSEA